MLLLGALAAVAPHLVGQTGQGQLAGMTPGDATAALGQQKAADERDEMGREMARLAERKAAAEGEYDQMAA